MNHRTALKREIDQIAKDKGIDRKEIIARARRGDAPGRQARSSARRREIEARFNEETRRDRAVRVPRGRRAVTDPTTQISLDQAPRATTPTPRSATRSA